MKKSLLTIFSIGLVFSNQTLHADEHVKKMTEDHKEFEFGLQVPVAESTAQLGLEASARGTSKNNFFLFDAYGALEVDGGQEGDDGETAYESSIGGRLLLKLGRLGLGSSSSDKAHLNITVPANVNNATRAEDSDDDSVTTRNDTHGTAAVNIGLGYAGENCYIGTGVGLGYSGSNMVEAKDDAEGRETFHAFGLSSGFYLVCREIQLADSPVGLRPTVIQNAVVNSFDYDAESNAGRVLGDTFAGFDVRVNKDVVKNLRVLVGATHSQALVDRKDESANLDLTQRPQATVTVKYVW